MLEAGSDSEVDERSDGEADHDIFIRECHARTGRMDREEVEYGAGELGTGGDENGSSGLQGYEHGSHDETEYPLFDETLLDPPIARLQPGCRQEIEGILEQRGQLGRRVRMVQRKRWRLGAFIRP